MVRRRTLTLVLVVVGLVGIVALLSRSHSSPSSHASQGNWRLAWEFVLVGIAALFVLSVPMVVWAFRNLSAEDLLAPEVRKKRTLWRRAAGLALAILAVGGAFAYHHFIHYRVNPSSSTNATHGHGRGSVRSVPFEWLPAGVVLSIAFLGACIMGYWLFQKSFVKPPTKAEIAGQLSALLDDSLDDLRAERDPRRAVIATYARMESMLAGFGFPRAASEAPREYLARVLRDLLQASADAVSKLTSLFERAKFSPHDVDPEMKSDAISALVEMRDELRATVPT